MLLWLSAMLPLSFSGMLADQLQKNNDKLADQLTDKVVAKLQAAQSHRKSESSGHAELPELDSNFDRQLAACGDLEELCQLCNFQRCNCAHDRGAPEVPDHD